MPGRVHLFTDHPKISLGGSEIQDSHADGEGVDLGIVVDKVVEAHFPGVDDDLVAVVIGHDPQGGNGYLGARRQDERVPVAVQDPELRIAQAIVAGYFQEIVAFLDAVVLNAPYQGEGLGVEAFGGGRQPEVVGPGRHSGLGRDQHHEGHKNQGQLAHVVSPGWQTLRCRLPSGMISAVNI